MPIGKAYVLEVLGDAMLRNIHFSVGPIHVNAGAYDMVAQYIADDAISVVPGPGPVSLYYPEINTLRTRPGEPPLNQSGRANLVHECTHIISDMNRCRVTRLADEVAAYLAQTTYLLLLNPLEEEPPMGLPLYDTARQCMRLVRKYKLGQPAGMGAIIDPGDVADLATLIHRIDIYAAIPPDAMLAADGVIPEGKKGETFWQRRLMRLANELADRLIADDVAQLLTQMMTTRAVAHDNYVTGDDELTGLLDAYRRGGTAQKKSAQQKLLRIFTAVDQRSATRLAERLSTPRKGDAVSARFHHVLPPPLRAALLSALQLAR